MSDGPAAGTSTIAVAAPAKINLYLHVTGRREAGYHELDSLVAFADIHDTIEVRPSAALSLKVEGPFRVALGDPTENIVLDAARALAEAAGVEPTARITLIKRLPVAAGIGGGSADAAATLRALSELWSISLPEDDLAALALKLGADVPVCLQGRPAFVGGIGEDLTPAPLLPPVPIVLANPLRALSTPKVFGAREGSFSDPARFDQIPMDAAALAALLAERANDLTDAAVALMPEVATVLMALEAVPGTLLARMSGSGATCFALYEDETAAARAAAVVAGGNPNWWVTMGKLLTAGV
ncbi:MAG: 4-(cytidine 5'-diphospho)-2-C-methyl-D-erythritol kinase [Alphaproteobacteria bacterium]